MKTIYLDYNATSPVRPQVSERIRPFVDEWFGNPSSLHTHGRKARAAVEAVRTSLLGMLGNTKGQLIFTSGGTEADNIALRGVAQAMRSKGDHLVVSAVEHHAVLHAAQALEEEGFRVTVVPADSEGVVNLQVFQEAITPKTCLISVMHANNEVGTIQPVEEIARMAHGHGVLFHTDAVQSFGKLPLDVLRIGADMVSISGHKLGGLKGSGALYLREGIRVKPLLRGGPHERNLRAGTEGVVGIVAMGVAAEMCLAERDSGSLDRIRRLRDHLEKGLRERLPDVELNGHPERRLPSTVNLSFVGCDGETLLMALDLVGICVSTGSACSSGSTEPSHVLGAMHLSPERIRGSIRFSLGWGTTEEEIEECLELIPPVIQRVRRVKRVGA